MGLQDFVKWVVCWIYMACWVLIESRWDWWSTKTPSMAKCAPFRLNRIIYRNRFNSIFSALRFTNREVPYEDGFFHMRQLEEAWNQNMAQQFCHHGSMFLMSPWWSGSTSGILDLCVSAVSRKPYPFGNEWHTICCALAHIMCRAHIVEGKGRPTEIGQKKWEDLGNTVGPMLGMCEPIFLTGKCVVLDSGFLCQRGSQPCWSLVSTLLRSSRAKILAQGCTGICHWRILCQQGCYSCGYVGGHNWRGSWG